MATTTTTATTAAANTLELNDWGYFLMTISWIFTTVSFAICCYAVYAGYHHYQQKKASSKNATRLAHQLKVIVLTVVCMWTFTAINICDSIGIPHWFAKDQGDYYWWYVENGDTDYETNNNWDDWWFNWEHSDKSYLMWNVFWAVAKIILYIVYLHRIYTIFGGTKYAPSQAVYCIIIIVLGVQTGLVCAWCWYYNISWSCCDIWADDQYETLAWLAWWILIVDIVLTLGLVFLFLWCMKQLFSAIKMHSVTQGVEMDVTLASKSELSDNSRTGQGGQVATVEEKEEVSSTSERQKNLIRTATRVFVLAMVSLCSSMFYQLLFGIAITEEFYGSHIHTAFYYFSFTWNVDSTLNVICLFLSLASSKTAYYKICKCDGCCFQCIQRMTA